MACRWRVEPPLHPPCPMADLWLWKATRFTSARATTREPSVARPPLPTTPGTDCFSGGLAVESHRDRRRRKPTSCLSIPVRSSLVVATYLRFAAGRRRPTFTRAIRSGHLLLPPRLACVLRDHRCALATLDTALFFPPPKRAKLKLQHASVSTCL